MSPRRVYFAIREGVRGTAMPSWKSLEEGEIWDLVALLLGVGEPAGPLVESSHIQTDQRK
jgi:hypothetical protein